MPDDELARPLLARLYSNSQISDDGPRILVGMVQMQDLYLRLHWWARNARLAGKDTVDVELGVTANRRKALELVMDPEADWDSVELHT